MADRNREQDRRHFRSSEDWRSDEEYRGGHEDDWRYGRSSYDYDQERTSYYPRRRYSADYPESESYGNEPSRQRYRSPGMWVYEEFWLIPGPFSGVGPRGFQQSDDEICRMVCQRLGQHGYLDARNIDVEVENGEVTLKGEVDSRQSKRLAEDIAESVYGVEDVHNQLHTRRKAELPGLVGTFTETGSRGETGMYKGSSSMYAERPRDLKEGQTVVGANGDEAGTIKEVHAYDFVIDRITAPDVHVPFTAVQDTSEDRVRLNVKADQIDKQGWTHLGDMR